MFLKMQLFGSLTLLMSLLGSSCPLLGRSGPKMGPKMGFKSVPKSDQKMIQNMFKTNHANRPQKGRSNELWGEIAGLRQLLAAILLCLSFFFYLFFRFWSSLIASWESSWVSWGSLGKPLDPKTCKNTVFFNDFEKAVSWSLKLLLALLGSSCFFLGKSGPTMGFQKGYQKCEKKIKK